MNKVFKIVFNAARGTRMVVNETTSSVQSGKKAAVTVAVIGALAASSAMADTTFKPDEYSKNWANGGTSYVSGTFGTPTGAILGGEVGGSGDFQSDDIDIGVSSSSLIINKDTVFNGTVGGYNWAIYGGSRLNAGHRDTDKTVQDGTTSVTLDGVKGYLDIIGGGTIRVADGAYESTKTEVTVINSSINGSGSPQSLNYGRIIGAGTLQVNTSGTATAQMTFEETVVNVIGVDGSNKPATSDPDEIAEIAATGTRVLGGGVLYAGYASAGGGKLTVKKTTVNIDNLYDEAGQLSKETKLEYVLGGSVVSGGKGDLSTGTTLINVKGGHVGLVIGGNHLNFFGNQVHLDNSTVNVSGGTINKVIGANYIDVRWEAANGSKVATANSSIVNVTGGNVHDVVGGGYASNGNEAGPSSLRTTIEKTEVNVSGVTITGNVIGGGLAEGEGAVASTTKEVSVNVKNATVEGAITIDNMAESDGGLGFVNTTAQQAQMSLTNVIASVVHASMGTVELRAEGSGQTSIGTLDVAEGVNLIWTADGAANDAAGGDIENLIAIDTSNEDLKATVAMEEGQVMGAVTAEVVGGEVTGATVAVNKKTEAIAEQVTLAPQMITRIMMNDVRKRMGDLRASEGTHGVWARYNGGQMAGSGMEADFNMVQVGIDTIPVVDAPRFGVAFSYAQTEADATNGLATTDMDSFSLAFYGTKMYDNGMFVDVIGRMATMDTEMTVQGNKAEMDNVALSLSGELGWRFDVTDQFFIEPSAELTYTYTNADTFKMGQGTYELESVDSLVGRAGFAAGFKCPANKGDVYVRAAVVHEFMGDSTMNSMVNGRSAKPVESDGEDTYFEYAVGAQFNVNKNMYVYADVERTEGANVDEDWRANVGVRFAF